MRSAINEMKINLHGNGIVGVLKTFANVADGEAGNRRIEEDGQLFLKGNVPRVSQAHLPQFCKKLREDVELHAELSLDAVGMSMQKFENPGLPVES